MGYKQGTVNNKIKFTFDLYQPGYRFSACGEEESPDSKEQHTPITSGR